MRDQAAAAPESDEDDEHDDDADTAPLPEQFQADEDDDDPLLYIQVLRPDAKPMSFARCVVQGGGVQHNGLLTDAQGELMIDDIAAGHYELVIAGKTVPVHTLYRSDLEESTAPYRIVVLE